MADFINKQIKRTGKFFAIFGTCIIIASLFPVNIYAKKPEAYVVEEQENIVIAAQADFGNYSRKKHKLWKKNFIQWELYDSERTVKPSARMSISYTLYVPGKYLSETNSALSIVHGVVLVDEKKQYMGISQNRGQSWFEPTCANPGELAMLRWDMAADEQAAARYASYKVNGDFYEIKVKNAPLSPCLDYDLSKMISKSKKVSLIPTIRIYGIGVSGQTFLMLDDITVRSGSKVLFREDCQDMGQEDGIFYDGITDKKSAVGTVVIGDNINALK